MKDMRKKIRRVTKHMYKTAAKLARMNAEEARKRSDKARENISRDTYRIVKERLYKDIEIESAKGRYHAGALYAEYLNAADTERLRKYFEDQDYVVNFPTTHTRTKLITVSW